MVSATGFKIPIQWINLWMVFTSLSLYAQLIEGPVERYPGGPWMVKVVVPDLDIIQKVAQWHEPRNVDLVTGTFLIDILPEDVPLLRDLGCMLELDEPQTQAIWKVLAGESVPDGMGIPGFSCYQTVDETFATAQTWVSDYPNLVSWQDIGDSWEKTQNSANGDDIWVAILTNQEVPGPKPVLFIMAAVHAREYTPAALTLDFGNYLLNEYGRDPDATWILDEHEVHLVLQANPDGRRQAETGLFWRKNTNNDFCTGSNLRGIDLNRNFPFQWGCCGGSSGSQCSEVFRGPSAASEPEVQAIRDYVRSIFPDQRGPNISDAAPDDATGIFLDLHSFSELVIWPYGFNNTPTPNGIALQTLGRKLAFFNNYSPEKASVSFSSDGTTDDFAYGDLGVAAFTFELGTTFFQNCSDYLNQIQPDNLAALKYAAKVVRTPYLTPAGPEVVSVQLSSQAIEIGGSVEVMALIDDGRFNQANGTEPVGQVAAVELYINVPPWRGGTPVPLQASDGTFDETEEEATAVLDASGLAQGRHLLFVRGQDENGQWGAMTAAFLYILDPNTAGTLNGTLTNTPTGLPLEGTITAGPFSAQSEAETGNYQLFVVPDTYQVTAASADHTSITASNVTAAASQSVPLSFQLEALCTVFSETETQGWIASGSWGMMPSHDNRTAFYWTDSPNGKYEPGSNTGIVSPSLDLSTYSSVVLGFSHLFDLPDFQDEAIVVYSLSGGPWQDLLRFSGSQTQWQQQSLLLPELAGEGDVRLGFLLNTDAIIAGEGWFLKDIVLKGAGPSCGLQVLQLFLEQWPAPASILNFIPLFP